jgi:hypothetical protein
LSPALAAAAFRQRQRVSPRERGRRNRQRLDRKTALLPRLEAASERPNTRDTAPLQQERRALVASFGHEQ